MNLLRKAMAAAKEIKRPVVASAADKRVVFEEWNEHLLWIAVMITGKPDSARRAVVNASELAENANSVFRDWLLRWAREATASAAIAEVRDAVLTASLKYVGERCAHVDHEPLSVDQVNSVRQLSLEFVHAELDTFARAILVLRGIHQNSMANCARSMGVPRDRVCNGYCHVSKWVEGIKDKSPECSRRAGDRTVW